MNNQEALEKVKKTDIVSEFQTSFLEYAMSVIVSRALPDVRDGLKPVQRRIIYTMFSAGITYKNTFKKSAKIIGEVMGKYHPHGDSSIYEAMVRMAQVFSTRYPLVLGQGNFGSIDGDNPAAMRYTEAKLNKITDEMVKDLEKKSVDFSYNYDDSELEPDYLPAGLPNLLLNGSIGIAVGMATSIPPHNLTELIGGIHLLLSNPEVTVTDLLKVVKGPDFPTGAQIKINSNMIQGYSTGSGSVVVRAKADIKGTEIIISEIPYNLNKTNLLVKIANLVKENVINGIKDLRDESNYKGVRIVIEVNKSASPKVILNRLFKLTPLQNSFNLNFIALDKGRPQRFNLKQLLEKFIEHRISVIKRRTKFDIGKFERRLHILGGLIVALQHIGKVVKIISGAKTNQEAQILLSKEFGITKEQAQAILDMKLARLTALEQDKLRQESDDITKKLVIWKDLLKSETEQKRIVREELEIIRKKYPSKRRTEITTESLDISEENLIEKEEILIIQTSNDYVKRVPTSSFKTQHRGGVGITGLSKKRDALKSVINCSTHDQLLLFSNKGKVYKLKAYEIISRGRTVQGIPLINLIQVGTDERIESIIVCNQATINDYYFLFATKNGLVKKTKASDFLKIRNSGFIAIKLKTGDSLLKVEKVAEQDKIMLASSKGFVNCFAINTLPTRGRNTSGLRGIRLVNDTLASVAIIEDNKGELMFVTEQGYGKKTLISNFKCNKRALKGLKGIKFKSPNDNLRTILYLNKNEDIIVATKNGKIIRMSTENIPILNRITMGVKLINLNKTTVKEALVVKN